MTHPPPRVLPRKIRQARAALLDALQRLTKKTAEIEDALDAAAMTSSLPVQQFFFDVEVIEELAGFTRAEGLLHRMFLEELIDERRGDSLRPRYALKRRE